MAAQFKVGDVVQLASGGPKMTIQGKGTAEGNVYCVWFHPTTFEKKADQFHPETLVKVVDN